MSWVVLDRLAPFRFGLLSVALYAVPAAVAIRHARLYERAEIYAAELQCRLQEISDSGDIPSTPEARKSSRS